MKSYTGKLRLLITAQILVLAFFALSGSQLEFASTAQAQTSPVANTQLPIGEIEANEIRFAAVGDTGTGDRKQYEVAERMLAVQRRTNYDLLLFLGDNVYESGSPDQIEDKFLKPYSRLWQNGVEFRGCLGNHDRRSKNGILLQQMIFGMGAKTFYSFTKGENTIEFFALDSALLLEKDLVRERAEQLVWFEKKLAESKARWKVLFLHHPLYSSAKKHGAGSSDEDEMLRLRELIEPLLQKYKVDFVISGHDHVYERTKPQRGIQYFISGAGGKLREDNLVKSNEFFLSGNDQINSFMFFSIKDRAVRFWAIGVNGEILDFGEIVKNQN